MNSPTISGNANNIGIGFTPVSVTNKLQVLGSVSIGNNESAILNNSLYVEGCVGIGVTNPSNKLEVNGQIKIMGGNPGLNKILMSNENGLATWIDNDVTRWNIDETNKYLYLKSDYNNYNIGIGITNPSQKFQVAKNVIRDSSGKSGQLAITGVDYPNDRISLGFDTTNNFGYIESLKQGQSNPEWTNTAINPEGGNVGIGTTAPGAKLDVLNGNIRLGTSSNQWELQQNTSLSGNFRDFCIDDMLGNKYFHVLKPSDPNCGNRPIGSFISYDIERYRIPEEGALTLGIPPKSNGNMDSGRIRFETQDSPDNTWRYFEFFHNHNHTLARDSLYLAYHNEQTEDVLTARFDANGDVRIHGQGYSQGGFWQSGGLDYAEQFFTNIGISTGDVVVIDINNDQYVTQCSTGYQYVVGVFSEHPGFLCVKENESGINVALSGRILCKADASFGTINRGDPLVTSSNSGYAMKGDPNLIKPGQLVGIAMEPLSSGTGLITVLVK